MRKYDHNPRQWTRKQRDELRENLRLLGDLSGIVHDLNSDQIVGGNFRSDVMDINKCKIRIIEQFDAPDEQGTVAFGFVEWNGKLYNYRQVRWSQEQCERACIAANAMGGSWDFDELANYWDDKPLSLYGLDLDFFDEKEKPKKEREKKKNVLKIEFESETDKNIFVREYFDKITALGGEIK